MPFPIYANIKEYIETGCKVILSIDGAKHTLTTGRAIGTLAALNKEEVIRALRQ